MTGSGPRRAARSPSSTASSSCCVDATSDPVYFDKYRFESDRRRRRREGDRRRRVRQGRRERCHGGWSGGGARALLRPIAAFKTAQGGQAVRQVPATRGGGDLGQVRAGRGRGRGAWAAATPRAFLRLDRAIWNIRRRWRRWRRRRRSITAMRPSRRASATNRRVDRLRKRAAEVAQGGHQEKSAMVMPPEDHDHILTPAAGGDGNASPAARRQFANPWPEFPVEMSQKGRQRVFVHLRSSCGTCEEHQAPGGSSANRRRPDIGIRRMSRRARIAGRPARRRTKLAKPARSGSVRRRRSSTSSSVQSPAHPAADAGGFSVAQRAGQFADPFSD